ncbi:MAG: DUF4099 domain-containing protein [Cyclobacteriaceae bacterium]|nr:DUF4099 domain-containing protein [Cyclobacteriaceae bacterium]
MNYEAKDLPYGQFEKLGMSRKDVLGMAPEELKSLLSGKTTGLQDLRVIEQETKIRVKARLSLQRLSDGSLNLVIHPVRNKIKNDDNLSQAQLDSLKNGERVIAARTSLNGEKELYLFQLDRETNEIYKVRQNSITIPRHLMEVELSPQQRSDLLLGKTIRLEDKAGNVHEVAVDLIDRKGYSVKTMERVLEPERIVNNQQGIKR